jgi:hypothetical protein
MSARNKQSILDKQRRRRQLKKLRSRFALPTGSCIVHNRHGVAKMSEVILDFVKPYWDRACTKEDMEKTLSLGIIAWNSALVPQEEREAFLQKSMNTFPAEIRADFRTVLDPLIERKLAYFTDNRRFILNYTLNMRSTGPYLEILSSLPGQ